MNPAGFEDGEGQPQKVNFHHPWTELLLDSVTVNDLAGLPSHKHQWHGGETDGPLC